jgi:hypothetical protein
VKIGYGKIGRSMPLTLDKCGNLGGDVEMVAVVKELALRHPDDQFYLIGRNTGEYPSHVGMPNNIINPWIIWGPKLRNALNAAGLNHANLTVDEHLKANDITTEITRQRMLEMNAYVIWLGQHGSTNMPIPKVGNRDVLTKPHDWCTYYVSYMLQGVNEWRDKDPFTREEIYLNADSRNYMKMRDLKWPLRHPVLTQYTFEHRIKHERYGDSSLFEEFSSQYDIGADGSADRIRDALGKVWTATIKNVYSRLEINGLAPGTPFGDLIQWNPNFDRPGHFGMFVNEARHIGINERRKRVNVMKEWVMPLNPHFIHGTWSDNSRAELAKFDGKWAYIKPAPWSEYYPMLHSVRCTFTTPSSGSGWATAKPWEAFAGGTVCFFHPEYDDQDNILSDAHPHLREWLRCETPEDLMRRVAAVNTSPQTFTWLITEQRKHFDEAMKEKRYLKMIEERIYG